jgi:DNA sulfur modification protein DndC
MGTARSFVEEISADLRQAYLVDKRPWIIGFSGGKDSTMVTQLVYYVLANIHVSERRKHVYVIASDTRVETPAIATRVRKELDSISIAAERDKRASSRCAEAMRV